MLFPFLQVPPSLSLYLSLQTKAITQLIIHFTHTDICRVGIRERKSSFKKLKYIPYATYCNIFMAIEARRQNLFSPKFILNNRQLVNGIDGHFNIYGTSIGHGGLLTPLSGTTMETFFPMYGSAIVDSFPTKPPPPQSDSGLTHILPVSRKRTRDSIGEFDYTQQNQNHLNHCGDSLSFLGEDISLQIQNQQFEIDNFIAQHSQKIISDIEKQLKPNARKIIAAVEERIVKKLRAKEEEVDKLGKINCALEEKVKSLCIENQIWRDLAQTNKATVTALRSNLEQVLSHVHHRTGATDAATVLADDAQSCCGSHTEEMLADNCGRGEDVEVSNGVRNHGGRLCRSCGKEESCVLVLPCRHLCLCTVCGSSLHVCPVCKSTKNGSLHINMSFS